ncbi:MAG TPA: hypothetical protein VFD43_00440, partial [Planctomycetota bacterium]|nr:hypothetical protein [Planctomycetota bacterium]
AAWQAKAQKWALPRIKAAVGDAPVDIVSHGQGIVFLNQLHYDPRPVFQSYIAYTDYLLRRNADHFAQAGGPEYVLIRPEAIDSRLQAMEDSLALRELARRYRPLFVEKGYLLAERIPPDRVASAPSEQVLRALDVGWGEWVDLEWAGDETVYLRLDIRYSPLGQVMKLLLRSPTVEIVLAGPSWAAHDRIVPSMMRAGILLQPYLRRLQSDQVATLWPALSGSTMAIPPDCRVRRFKLDVGNEDWERCFSPRIGVRLVALRSNAAGGDPGK